LSISANTSTMPKPRMTKNQGHGPADTPRLLERIGAQRDQREDERGREEPEQIPQLQRGVAHEGQAAKGNIFLGQSHSLRGCGCVFSGAVSPSFCAASLRTSGLLSAQCGAQDSWMSRFAAWVSLPCNCPTAFASSQWPSDSPRSKASVLVLTSLQRVRNSDLLGRVKPE